MIQAAGVGVMAAGLGATATAATADDKTPTASSTDDEPCLALTTEQIEGPYYLDYDIVRQHITEDRTGVPLWLRLKVIDGVTCEPLRGAAVDVWHCDALGVYSGYISNGNDLPNKPSAGKASPPPPGGGHQKPTDKRTYLRGTQMTDRHGLVTFGTVFPGWYQGRAVHIHTKVKVDGEQAPGGYEGGHQCHTGQLYFSEDAVRAVAQLDPYAENDTDRVTLGKDMVYPGKGARGGLLDLKYDKHLIQAGVLATLTMSVDPDATHDGSNAPK